MIQGLLHAAGVPCGPAVTSTRAPTKDNNDMAEYYLHVISLFPIISPAHTVDGTMCRRLLSPLDGM